MTYSLGAKSLAALDGVHPELVRVVKRAIAISDQDFTVFEGLRTPERQAEYLRRGVTKTKNSKHLVQPDGYGHAVDLVPWIDGVARWDWGPIYHIAAAMREASIKENVPLTFGGVWDKRLNEIQLGQMTGAAAIKKAVADYCVRHPGPDFIDGPHYQLA